MPSTKEYNIEKMYRIMNVTQSNYANMMKRLQGRKDFSNFVITYYSIALIVYSLTAQFFPEYFDVKLSSYFNIILSVVVLTYSLIISKSNYTERIHGAERILNEVKSKKRELTDANLQEKKSEYDEIMSGAEYRAEVDFFKTIKQMCKENGVKWYWYKGDIKKLREKGNEEEAEKLNNYLSENFPMSQQIKIIVSYLRDTMIIIIPLLLFLLCFAVKWNFETK